MAVFARAELHEANRGITFVLWFDISEQKPSLPSACSPAPPASQAGLDWKNLTAAR